MANVTPGILRVSNDCIADLAGYAALECYGVVGMADTESQTGVIRLLPTYRLRKGVSVAAEASSVVIDLHVIVEAGINFAQVSSNLVSTVKFILSKIAELDDVLVNVHIEGMRTN